MKIISVLITLLIINTYSFSQPKQENPIKEADLLLDMMEYESAIVRYLKILSLNPLQRDIRKKIAYAYLELTKTDDALNFLKEELSFFPDNGDAYDFLVFILSKLNKLEQANKFLESLDFPVRLTEDNPHIGGLGCFVFGMYFKKMEKSSRAEAYFKKALEKGYDPVKCYVQLLDIDFFQRGYVYAPKIIVYKETALPEAIEMCGVQPEFHFLNGLRYLEKSKLAVYFFPASLKFFKAALNLKPDFKDALFNLACISYNYKDFLKASEYFTKILEIEPENAEVKSYLDCCLKKLDETIDKEVIAEQCPKTLNLSRDFIDKPDMEYKHRFSNDVSFVLESINHLGLEFVRNGKFEEGLKRFRNGLKIYPESPGINFNMGIVYSWQNNLEEAEKHALLALRVKDFFGRIPDYRKREILEKEQEIVSKPPKIPISEWTFETALKEGNYFLDAYNSLGTIYFKKREFHRSILAFEKVIEIYNKDAMGHYNLGCAYWEINDWRNAEKEWKDAIKYEEESKREKKRGKIAKSQLDVSLIVFKRVVSFRAHKCLGRLYLNKNLPEKAQKEFEKAIDLEPGDPEPYYELGKMYESKSELGEKYLRKAIFYYEKYLYLGGEKEKEVKEILKSIK